MSLADPLAAPDPAPTPAAAPAAAPNLEAGLLLVAIGAVLLLVSLFLAWYAPGIEAWDVFEVWDLVLAALALVALAAVAGRLGYGPPRPNSWLLGPAVVAFVVVVAALLDHPPLVDGQGHDPRTGIWLALVATVLMVAGTVLSVARISVALNVGDAPLAPAPGRRFGRGRRTAPVEAEAPPPVAATPRHVAATPPTEPTRRL
jgi:peptidoglycan/LPS O-acetylase OafA/YrhL